MKLTQKIIDDLTEALDMRKKMVHPSGVMIKKLKSRLQELL